MEEIKQLVEKFFALFELEVEIDVQEKKVVVNDEIVKSSYNVMIDAPKDKRPLLIGFRGKNAKFIGMMINLILKAKGIDKKVALFVKP